MSNESRRDPTTPVFDDPDAQQHGGRAAIVSAAIASATVYGATFPPNPPLWGRAKDLTRADLWALAGWGTTDKFNGWTEEEKNVLATAISMHLGGKQYTGMKYVCSCCG